MYTSILHRKDAIVISTVEAIDELGIQGVSTREIARRQGISEGAIFKHFKSKNDLIYSVLDYYSKFDGELISSNENMTYSKEHVLYLFSAYCDVLEKHPELIAITDSYDFFIKNPQLKKKITDVFKNRRVYLNRLIKQGKEVGDIKKEIDAEMASDILWSVFRSSCSMWRYSDYNFSLKKYIMCSVEVLLNLFSKK